MKECLGYSVCIEEELSGIVLTTENGLPDDPSNTIYLGKSEIIGLNKFIERMKNE